MIRISLYSNGVLVGQDSATSVKDAVPKVRAFLQQSSRNHITALEIPSLRDVTIELRNLCK